MPPNIWRLLLTVWLLLVPFSAAATQTIETRTPWPIRNRQVSATTQEALFDRLTLVAADAGVVDVSGARAFTLTVNDPDGLFVEQSLNATIPAREQWQEVAGQVLRLVVERSADAGQTWALDFAGTFLGIPRGRAGVLSHSWGPVRAEVHSRWASDDSGVTWRPWIVADERRDIPQMVRIAPATFPVGTQYRFYLRQRVTGRQGLTVRVER